MSGGNHCSVNSSILVRDLVLRHHRSANEYLLLGCPELLISEMLQPAQRFPFSPWITAQVLTVSMSQRFLWGSSCSVHPSLSEYPYVKHSHELVWLSGLIPCCTHTYFLSNLRFLLKKKIRFLFLLYFCWA